MKKKPTKLTPMCKLIITIFCMKNCCVNEIYFHEKATFQTLLNINLAKTITSEINILTHNL